MGVEDLRDMSFEEFMSFLQQEPIVLESILFLVELHLKYEIGEPSNLQKLSEAYSPGQLPDSFQWQIIFEYLIQRFDSQPTQSN